MDRESKKMASLKELQSRINSLQTTKKITDAMRMIALTKYRRSLKSFFSLDSFVSHFKETSKYFRPIPTGELSYAIIMAPSRGLCGSLNTRLNRFLKDKFEDTQCFIIGQSTFENAECFPYPKNNNQRKIFEELVSRIVHYKKITLIYIHFLSPSKSHIETMDLFPWAYDDATEFHAINDVKAPLRWFQTYLKHCFCQAFSHTAISENASRMLAMDAAGKNTKKLVSELKLTYNKKRQELITKEILETGASLYDE